MRWQLLHYNWMPLFCIKRKRMNSTEGFSWRTPRFTSDWLWQEFSWALRCVAICHGAVTSANLCITGMLELALPGSCEGDGQMITQLFPVKWDAKGVHPSWVRFQTVGSEHDQCTTSSATTEQNKSMDLYLSGSWRLKIISYQWSPQINSLISVSIPGVNWLN